MYDEWVLPDGGEPESGGADFVLLKLPSAAALEVVRSLVGQLAGGPLCRALSSEEEVRWCMSVVGYGLTPAMTDVEQMSACVTIYCQWLSVLGDSVHASVPEPVRQLPHVYAGCMLRQLQLLFAPRSEPSAELLRCQTSLCRTVSATIDRVSAQGSRLQPDTWHELLTFTVRSTDFLLAPPSVSGDTGQQLCVTTLHVLFNVWLRASVQCFPSPPLWRLLREHCQFWRHRVGLVVVWSRVILLLTKCVVANMYGTECACVSACGLQLPADILCQVWFRMLHILGNPVELSDAMTISHTQQFMRYAIVGSDVVEPCHHPCLASLPTAFLACFQALSEIANLYLGLEHRADLQPVLSTVSAADRGSTSVDAAWKRTGIISDRVPSFVDDLSNAAEWCTQMAFCHDERSTLMMGRPSCNSIVKLLGSWLFEAAAVGSSRCRSRKEVGWPSVMANNPASSLANINKHTDLPDNLLPNRFNEGRACALGVLCRIFCAKRFDEEITPIYLATFYRVLFDALCQVCDDPGGERIISAILLNGWRLLQVDLDGVNCLLPSLIDTLKLFFNGDTQGKSMADDNKFVKNGDYLRNAAVRLLVSAVPLPMHFQSLVVREFGGSHAPGMSACNGRGLTFIQLRPKLLHMLVQCLQHENQSTNCQLLLSAAAAVVLDGASLEAGISCDDSIDRQSSSQHSSLPLVTDSSVSDLPLESVSGFYTRMLQLVTSRLVSEWKSDFGVSLAALEFLTSMASIHIELPDISQCKVVLNRLCRFFEDQCSRPPQHHSKDLHSTMVVALQCISVWLLEHACLLEDPELLQTVLTVVELGISGRISSDAKEDKPLRPVSMRVSEMAETLLYILMEQVGCVPSNGTMTHTCSDLSESSLLAHCPPGARFKYVVCDSLLLALLDQPPSSSKLSLPSVTLIVRGPSLRTAWNLQLRYKPRHLADLHHVNPGRPIPATATGEHNAHSARGLDSRSSFPISMMSYFPSEYFEGLTSCNADRSIPNLECLARDEDFDTFRKCLDKVRMDSSLECHADKQNSRDERHGYDSVSDCECSPPDPKEEFSTTRLLLCHLQLLDSVSKRSSGLHSVSGFPSNKDSRVFLLDDQKPDFFSQLNSLDMINFRPRFLVNSYYVGSGESDASEILRNNMRTRVASCDGITQYGALLKSLGRTLPRSTVQSCESHSNSSVEQGSSTGEDVDRLLIWTDDLVEFIVATPSQNAPVNQDCSSCSSNALPIEVTSLKPSFVLVWLQDYADCPSFPLTELVPASDQVRCLLFVHPLKSGLFRVIIQWSCGGQSSSKSGMSASRSTLDSVLVGGRSLVRFLRQTIISSCHRGYLEAEIGHTPHVQRRIKINEIRQNFQSSVCNSDLSWLSI